MALTPALTKHGYAATLAATFAYFLSQQGDAVGVTRFDDAVRDYLPPRNRPGHLRRLMLALEHPAEGTATEFGGPLERIAQMHDVAGCLSCSQICSRPSTCSRHG